MLAVVPASGRAEDATSTKREHLKQAISVFQWIVQYSKPIVVRGRSTVEQSLSKEVVEHVSSLSDEALIYLALFAWESYRAGDTGTYLYDQGYAAITWFIVDKFAIRKDVNAKEALEKLKMAMDPHEGNLNIWNEIVKKA